MWFWVFSPLSSVSCAQPSCAYVDLFWLVIRSHIFYIQKLLIENFSCKINQIGFSYRKVQIIQSSVLSPQSSVLSPMSLHSVLSPQSSVLSPQSSVLSPQSSVLCPLSSVLCPQSSSLSLYLCPLSSEWPSVHLVLWYSGPLVLRSSVPPVL